MADIGKKEKPKKTNKVGVWLIGARGAISVTTMVGKAALQAGKVQPLGMISESYPFDRLSYIKWEDIQFGGCDVHEQPLDHGLQNLIQEGIIPHELSNIASHSLTEEEKWIIDICKVLSIDSPRDLKRLNTWMIVDKIRENLSNFKADNGLDRIIVVNLSSTERLDTSIEELEGLDWKGFERTLKGSSYHFPWGLFYATSALLEGCAFINFTPNAGTEIQALKELAEKNRLPHVGKDGKTGETLIKTVLGPMLEERAFKVLSWQSYNMLGNNDGKTLSDPLACKAKIRSKDRQLRDILKKSPDLHTKVSIDYVPSLGDWKTAWNFIHFEGFLGRRMSLQFTWQGCDTILAVPLVLDLIRFTELAWRTGEFGHLSHLDAYFKSPTGCNDHDFRKQMNRLYKHFNLQRCKSCNP